MMFKKSVILWLVCAGLILALAGCQSTGSAPTITEPTAAAATASQALPGDTTTGATSTATTTESTAPATTAPASVAATADIAAVLEETHDDAEDVVFDSAAAVPIALNGDSISADAPGVTVNGSIATITAAGTYSLSGTLNDGQIVVDTDDEDAVQLILNGVTIANSTSAPIYVANAEEVVIVLADGTQNSLSDAATYVYDSADEDEPNAALFANADLTISGNGALTVTGNYNDGISSDDGLVISGGTITVTAADDGIRGKDYLVVEGGNVTVDAGGDALKSDNDEDATLGYILIEGGTFDLTAAGDGLQAETDVLISDGTFAIVSGGGSDSVIGAEDSAKGIKGGVDVHIAGGTFNVDSADDALHANGSVTVDAGVLTLASGDDALHADAALTVNGGEIAITQSFEGLEGATITLNAGDIHLVASDDGVNVAGGNDTSGQRLGPGLGGGQDAAATSYADGAYTLTINGGAIVVDATGDGLDVNGSFVMTGGTVLVNGPTEQMNGALDYDGTFTISGGLLVAAGSAGMAQAPGTSSTQNSVLILLDGAQSAGTMVNFQSAGGEEVVTFAPSKSYQALLVSSAALAMGESYDITLGGSSTGTAGDGLYSGGTYTPGTLYDSFTVSSAVTQVGSGGGGPRP